MPPDAAASKPLFRIDQEVFEVPFRPAWVMGIVNVTPDSFSDGGIYFDVDRAVARALQQIEEGARIIDVGAESTRPGSSGVAAEEQVRRAVPVIAQLRAENASIPISVDTTSAEVARAAIQAGANMINDTSALRDDPKMVDIAAASNAAVVLMHRRGMPLDMQQDGGPVYSNLVEEILGFLRDRVEFAVSRGVDLERIAIDPGIGFGKQAADNMRILACMAEITESGRPVVVGVSRKKFIGETLGLTQPKDRMIGSVASAIAAAIGGASIIRAHDVLETVQALTMWDAISRA